MTPGQTATEHENDSDERWRAWLARGAAHDRRTNQRLLNVILTTGVLAMSWLFARLL